MEFEEKRRGERWSRKNEKLPFTFFRFHLVIIILIIPFKIDSTARYSL